jgi:dTDP-4-dehydrorhamnose 3,5-epimerase
MTTNLAVPVGTVRVLLVDERADSATSGLADEISLGDGNYGLLIVPPFVWSGFHNDSPSTVLVANCASLPHDPAEVERRDANDSRMPQPWSNRRA